MNFLIQSISWLSILKLQKSQLERHDEFRNVIRLKWFLLFRIRQWPLDFKLFKLTCDIFFQTNKGKKKKSSTDY